MESLLFHSSKRDQIQFRFYKRIEALQKGYRQNIGLIGRRALGKTHLLGELFQQYSNQPDIIPIYFNAEALDLDHLVERWAGSIFSGFLAHRSLPAPEDFQSLLSLAESYIPRTAEKIRSFKRIIRRERSVQAVKEFFSLTGLLAEETGKKILLMMDEFDHLSMLPAPDPFALMGKEIMIQKNTLYLMASSSQEKARGIFRDQLSLLFGNFEVIEIAPLGFTEILEFIGLQLPQRKFSDPQKRLLISLSNGEPIYLKLLLTQLKSFLSDSGTSGTEVPCEALLEAFRRELFEETGKIHQIFENRMAACRRLAKDNSPYLRTLLAISDGRRKALGIATYIERKVRETKKILQRLVQEGFVTKSGSFYILGDPLFQFWLIHVFQRRHHLYTPDETGALRAFYDALMRCLEAGKATASEDMTARVEALFKEFRNDVVEVDQRKVQCPQFSEIAFRPTNGRVFPLLARNPKVRWFCQIAKETVREEDIATFLDELKRSRRRVQRKIFIALAGIEQNAKLMAQAAKIQLWGLRNFNDLLELYHLPKMVIIPNSEVKEPDGSNLGPLAQNLSSA